MTICAYTFAKLNLLSNRIVSFSDTLQPFVHGLPLKGCKADWNRRGAVVRETWVYSSGTLGKLLNLRLSFLSFTIR